MRETMHRAAPDHGAYSALRILFESGRGNKYLKMGSESQRRLLLRPLALVNKVRIE
jgi:hypothetical protein